MIFFNFGVFFSLSSEIFAGSFGSHMLNNGVDKCPANFYTRTLFVLQSFNFSKCARASSTIHIAFQQLLDGSQILKSIW